MTDAKTSNELPRHTRRSARNPLTAAADEVKLPKNLHAYAVTDKLVGRIWAVHSTSDLARAAGRAMMGPDDTYTMHVIHPATPPCRCENLALQDELDALEARKQSLKMQMTT